MDSPRCLLLVLLFLACLQGARGACSDSLGNCAAYGSSVCTSYKAWAQDNCQNFCHFCTGGAPAGSGGADSCVDVIDNCAALGPNVCDAYVEFAHINCQKTCNLCAASTQQSECVDKLSNCAAYGQTACGGQYVQWATDNCPKFCNLCPSGSSTGGAQYSDVCFYKGQAYHEGDQWRDGCEKNCTCVDQRRGYYLCQDLCPTYQNLPADCHMQTAPGECCGKPVCPQRTGCDYKGHTYQQGQQWKDGCQYLCTCKDGRTGYYECNALCVTWQLLPQCTLQDPAPGLCCKTPMCPSNIQIHYPEGYTAQ